MEASDGIAKRVSDGHAPEKHLKKFGDIGVTTKEQYRAHIYHVLNDHQTECFTAYVTAHSWRKADIYYHEPTNTLIAVPENRKYEPTAHRPKSGRFAFEAKHKEAQKLEKRSIEIDRGRQALEQRKARQTTRSLTKSDNHQQKPHDKKSQEQARIQKKRQRQQELDKDRGR